MSPILDLARPLYQRQIAQSEKDATVVDGDKSVFEHYKVIIFCKSPRPF